MEDLLKRYYAHPTARERALFLAEYAAEPALAAEERETIELLSRLLTARFGARPERRQTVSDRFLTAFMDLRVTYARDSGFLSRGKQKKEVLRAFAALLLPDFLIEPISENPRFPALLSAEWRDFADTLFRSCLRDPAYRSRVFAAPPRGASPNHDGTPHSLLSSAREFGAPRGDGRVLVRTHRLVGNSNVLAAVQRVSGFFTRGKGKRQR